MCLFTPRDRQIVPSKTHRLLTGTNVLTMAGRDIGTLMAPGGLENDVVFINRGECDGMKEGCTSHIPSRPARRGPVLPEPQTRYTRRVVGECMVLKAFEKKLHGADYDVQRRILAWAHHQDCFRLELTATILLKGPRQIHRGFCGAFLLLWAPR